MTDPNVQHLIKRARWAADLDRAADQAEEEGDEAGEAALRARAERMWEQR